MIEVRADSRSAVTNKSPTGSYCGNEVRNNDYYRYICCLFAPDNLRERLFALYAFNFEISKIKDITSEPMTGLIRLTWWNEAIDEIYSGKIIRQHEVVKALDALIKNTNIPHEYFKQIIEARETDIGLKPIMDSEGFQKYLDDTSGALLKASLCALGINNEAAFETANHIGTAYALVGQMRTLKWNAEKKHIFLPQNILDKHSVSLDNIAEGKHLENTKPIVRELLDKAEIHLKHAMALKKSLPPEAMPIYLHGVIALSFLKRIRKNDYDLFHSDLEGGKLGILIKMFFAAKFA